MVKKNANIVGIEVRKTQDPKTKVVTEKYYLHAYSSDATMVEGIATFSAKIPDDILPLVEIDSTYDIVYRSYNGWNTVEGLYHV